MDSHFTIESLLLECDGLTVADDPEQAYRAFSDGRVIIAEGDPTLLDQFAKANHGEFWGDQIERGPKGFCYVECDGKRYYFTFHKHKIREVAARRLQELELSK